MGEFSMKANIDIGEVKGYTIEAPTLSSWLKQDIKPLLLDIRDLEDYSKYFIKDSIHSEWDEVTSMLENGQLPRDRKIVVICYVGISSAEIATDLRLAGYDAYTLKDGILGEWHESGYPLVKRT